MYRLMSWLQKPKTSKVHKQPDWLFRLLTSPFRRLPDFVILGTQKGGTTALYEYLVTGSPVLPALTKEVHYFDLNYDKGSSWYRAHFPLGSSDSYQRVSDGRKSAVGEATPYYLMHPKVPERLAQLMPQAKLVIALRNPVDRAWSHYHHKIRRKMGRETLSFEDAIAAEPARLNGEFEKLLKDENYSGLNYRAYSYLSRGIYIDQLKRWRARFPPEQMLVLKSEDFFINPAAVVNQTTDFLDLPRQSARAYPPINQGTYAPMAEAVRQRLVDYFAPYNQQLYDLLDVDFGWDS